MATRPPVGPGVEGALAALRSDINRTYGFLVGSRLRRFREDMRTNRVGKAELKAELMAGMPLINKGPCAIFAKIFREEWNARFRRKASIAFVVLTELPGHPDFTMHTVVRLPDGRYFDGGNGLMTRRRLIALHRRYERLVTSGRVAIRDMLVHDDAVLGRFIPREMSFRYVPDFSASRTRRLIRRRLEAI